MKIRLFGLIECDGLKKEKGRLKSNKHRHSRAGGNDGGWVWGGVKVSGCLGKGSLKMGGRLKEQFQTAFWSLGL
ncbi:TPA: hypothetical protein ACU8BN_001913 [Neisseria subflava]